MVVKISKYDTSVRFAPKVARTPSTEPLTHAHFETLTEVFTWWNLQPHFLPQGGGGTHGYTLVVKTENGSHSVWGIDLVRCVELALKWYEKG